MDKLGVSAQEGLKVVMRQTFYGGYFSLTDYNNNPNPDYWLSYLHKQLVGQHVLSIARKDQQFGTKPDRLNVLASNDIRLYAHCTKSSKRYVIIFRV